MVDQYRDGASPFICNGQVWKAVMIEISDRDAIRRRSSRVCGERWKGASTIAQKHRHGIALEVGNHEIEVAILVEVAGRYAVAVSIDAVLRVGAECSATRVEQHGNSSGAAKIHNRNIIALIVIKVAGDHSLRICWQSVRRKWIEGPIALIHKNRKLIGESYRND